MPSKKLNGETRFSFKQRVAYKVTTMRKHSHLVADNLLNRQFNQKRANQIWAGDIGKIITKRRL